MHFSYFSGSLLFIPWILNTAKPKGWPLYVFRVYAHLLGEYSGCQAVS